MTRKAPEPHMPCGSTRVGYRHEGGARHSLGCAIASAIVAAVLALSAFGWAGRAHAQATVLPPPPGTALPGQPAFPVQPGGIFGNAPKIDNAAPLYLQGDQLIYDTKANRVVARGNVEIYYNNFVLTADEIIYDQGANKLTARGNAQLKDPNGNITRGEVIETTDDFRDAFIQSLSVVARDDTRIAAQRAFRREGNITEFEQGKFTPCKSDGTTPPLWCISAARIVHDQQAATITYQDAQFEIFGVPVVYLPYFQHADPSVKRRSGFLTPSFTNASQLGFGVSVPYYFALASNYDFLFEPTYYTKQGLFLKGTFRHRLENGQYMVRLTGIDQDGSTVPAIDPNKNSGWRGSAETRGVFSLGSWWQFGWDITVQSDSTFRQLYKLDNVLQTDRINTAFLRGVSDRNYFSVNLYQFGGLLLDQSQQATARVMPVIDYNYIFGQPVAGGELSANFHARSLTRSDGADSSRAVAELNWRRKIIDGLGQVWTPFVGARGDIVSYDTARDPNDLTKFQSSDTLARATGKVGLQYSYPFVAHTMLGSSIIAPTAQITARPNQPDQRRLPDEDAKSLVFDDTLLFDMKDKFSGFDRMESGTRADAGLKYTFTANNGFSLRAVVGQSFQLGGNNAFANPGKDVSSTVAIVGDPADPVRNAALNDTNFSQRSGLENTRSDYVAGLYITPIRNLALVSQSRFDASNWQLRRQDTAATVTAGPVFAQVGYAFRGADPVLGITTNQQDVIGSLGLRLTDRWSILGSVRYDLTGHKLLQDIAQLKYADECFILTATYTETFITNAALGIQPDRTVMVRFDFKHLGDFAFKTDTLNNVFGVNQPQVPR